MSTGKKTLFWDKLNFGGGKQYCPFVTQIFDPTFLPGFKINEIWVLANFTFLAWKTEDWIVQAAYPFLEEALAPRGIGDSAIRRHVKTWINAGFLEVIEKDYKDGFRYLVDSVLLQERERPNIANWQASLFLTAKRYKNQDKPVQKEQAKSCSKPVQKERASHSKETGEKETPCLEPVQKEHHRSIDYSFLSDEIEDAPRQRCPTDRSEGNGEAKGIRLTADDFPKTATGLVAKLDAEIERRQKERAQLVEGENLQVTC